MSWQDEIAHEEQIEEALIALVQSHARLRDVSLLKPLVFDAQSWVLQVSWQGQMAVLQRDLSDDAAEMVRAMQAELTHLATAMTGDCRAPRCLLALPDAGVIVLSHVPGERLDRVLERAKGGPRADLMELCGRLLASYGEGRSHDGVFSPKTWLERLDQLKRDRISDPQHRAVLQRLIDHLYRMRPDLRGTPVTRAASPAEFLSKHLYLHDGALHAAYVQGEIHRPVALDVARFLVWQQIRSDDHAQRPLHGIAHRDIKSLLRGTELDKKQQRQLLPFFIGLQLAVTLVHEYKNKRLRANTLRVIQSYLSAEAE